MITKDSEVCCNWIDDQSAISVIAEKMGLECDDTEIEVSDIDRKRSKENRAREVPLDKERVQLIAVAQRERTPMPKIVVRLVGEKYVIAGGNHRFSAYAEVNRMRQSIPVHRVVCTDAQFEVLCRLLNTVVGQGMSKQERIANAADAVERMGLSQREAAFLYGVDQADVSKQIRFARISDAVNLPSHVTKTHIFSVPNDQMEQVPIRNKWIDLLSKSKLTCDEVKAIAAKVAAATSEAGRIGVLEQESCIYEKVKKSPIPRTKRKALLCALGQLESVICSKVVSLESLEVLPEERKEIAERCHKLASILKSL